MIAGSSAVAAVVGDSTTLGASFAATAAVLAALDLTFGMSRRATTHASLAQQFAQLEREMVPHEHDENVDAAVATGFRQRRLEIEESEPPKLRVIDLLSHNELVTSAYRHEKLYPVGLVRRWVGHVLGRRGRRHSGEAKGGRAARLNAPREAGTSCFNRRPDHGHKSVACPPDLSVDGAILVPGCFSSSARWRSQWPVGRAVFRPRGEANSGNATHDDRETRGVSRRND